MLYNPFLSPLRHFLFFLMVTYHTGIKVALWFKSLIVNNFVNKSVNIVVNSIICVTFTSLLINKEKK